MSSVVELTERQCSANLVTETGFVDVSLI